MLSGSQMPLHYCTQFIFRKCKLFPLCQGLVGSHSRRLLLCPPIGLHAGRDHTAPEPVLFVLLQGVLCLLSPLLFLPILLN